MLCILIISLDFKKVQEIESPAVMAGNTNYKMVITAYNWDNPIPNMSQMLHVWNIYLHFHQKWPKCRYIFPTWDFCPPSFGPQLLLKRSTEEYASDGGLFWCSDCVAQLPGRPWADGATTGRTGEVGDRGDRDLTCFHNPGNHGLGKSSSFCGRTIQDSEISQFTQA